MRMGGEAMVVGYEKIALVFVLHPDEIADSPEIISQMDIPGGTDAADDNFLLFHVQFIVSFIPAPFPRIFPFFLKTICKIIHGSEIL